MNSEFRLIEVTDPAEILAQREAHPDEDLIFTRLPRHILTHAKQGLTTGIFDWDFTCTRDEAQWQAVQREFLTGPLAQDEDADRHLYYGGQQDYGESLYPGNDWWLTDPVIHDLSSVQASYGTRSIMRWAMAGVTRDNLIRVGAQQVLREGLKEIMGLMRSRLIVSFGIEDLIMASLMHHDLQAQVAAIRLLYHEDGTIRSHHPRVICNATKGLVVDRFLLTTFTPAYQVLSVGDSIGDIEMMRERGFNVLLMPRRNPIAQIAKWRDGHLRVLWDKVSVVVVSDTLWPIHWLLTNV